MLREWNGELFINTEFCFNSRKGTDFVDLYRCPHGWEQARLAVRRYEVIFNAHYLTWGRVTSIDSPQILSR